MFYQIPPSGTPFSLSDAIDTIRTRISSGDSNKAFEEAIKTQTGTNFCFLLNSGRTALLFALKALQNIDNLSRNEVIVPAYTCPSVASAVASAGLKIKLIDINPSNLDYDYNKLCNYDFSNVLSIIGCNLFGVLNNWEKLESIAREKRVFLIDDAAQAMGSDFLGRKCGCFGDIGFYSLDRGKNLSTYSGGILVTSNKEIAAQIENYMQNLMKSRFWEEVIITAKMVLSGLFLRPRLYWLPRMILFEWIPWVVKWLGRGEAYFVDYFPTNRLTEIQKSAGLLLYSRLENLNAIRVANAQEMGKSLLESGRFMIPGFNENNCPVYLRLPLLFNDYKNRDLKLAKLRKRGIQASTMYLSTIRQIPGIEKHLVSTEKDFPGAEDVIEKLLTLPTHPYMDQKHRQIAVKCLIEK